MATDADIDWLTSPAAVLWLEIARDWSGDRLALATRLRKDLSSERARLVIEQAHLRRRAAEKFARAERMFFTARGLEQATDDVVARYKAARFPDGDPAADLCCGIGGDLMALAARGSVTGVERDRTTATFAQANLRMAIENLRLSSVTPDSPGRGEVRDRGSCVMVADVADFSIADFAAWHLDPDRRPTGRRTTRVELQDPGPQVVVRLLAECRSAAMKLAPAAVLNDSGPASLHESPAAIPWLDAELEWISRKRQCRQLVAWFGSLARTPGQCRATVLASDLSTNGEELVVGSFVGLPAARVPVAERLGRFVFEPDAAVLAADLTGALAAELRLQAVATNVAYLTGDELQNSPLLAAFEVLDAMPYQPKALKSWLRVRRIGRLEVKKRGIDLDPQRVRRELNVHGDERATLLLCRIDRRVTAVLARRT